MQQEFTPQEFMPQEFFTIGHAARPIAEFIEKQQKSLYRSGDDHCVFPATSPVDFNCALAGSGVLGRISWAT